MDTEQTIFLNKAKNISLSPKILNERQSTVDLFIFFFFICQSAKSSNQFFHLLTIHGNVLNHNIQTTVKKLRWDTIKSAKYFTAFCCAHFSDIFKTTNVRISSEPILVQTRWISKKHKAIRLDNLPPKLLKYFSKIISKIASPHYKTFYQPYGKVLR